MTTSCGVSFVLLQQLQRQNYINTKQTYIHLSRVIIFIRIHIIHVLDSFKTHHSHANLVLIDMAI